MYARVLSINDDLSEGISTRNVFRSVEMHMHDSLWLIGGLAAVMGLVLLLPFFSKKIEEELETFLLVMGVASVSISRLWTWHLLSEALTEPIKITLAVLLAGFVFRALRSKIRQWTDFIVSKIGYGLFLFVMVVFLGLASSVMTAIIAALVLVEIVSALKLSRSSEVKATIIACFAIGFGAVLTPVGEPLATIAISKLSGAPYHADFFFLLRLLGKWVIPVVLGLGVLVMFWKKPAANGATLTQDSPETKMTVIYRAVKVYIFVLALVLLGTGFTPLAERYLIDAPVKLLYWINISSAVLDNATLTAAEISPSMSLETIQYLLIGLLVAGGMLIPGNIPNIICANKLSIKSKEWAMFGIPLGLILMVGFFIILTFV